MDCEFLQLLKDVFTRYESAEFIAFARIIFNMFSTLKILALHGYRQSDVVFNGKIGSLRKGFKKQIDFTFIRAPHRVPGIPSDTPDDAEEYGWWFNNENLQFKATEPSNAAVGFHESLTLVETTFREQGPFDGILGFSQGAAFGAILCAVQQNKLSPISFDFAILLSGFRSLCQPHSCFYDKVINIPCLQIYGTTDKIIPTEMAEDLAGIFANADVVTHEGGHYVPGQKHLYKNFIEKMLARNNDS